MVVDGSSLCNYLDHIFVAVFRLWVTFNKIAPTGQIFMKFDIWVFFENLYRKFKLHENLTRMTGTLDDNVYIYYNISLNSS